jgi:polysaccharide export outer membrane protein
VLLSIISALLACGCGSSGPYVWYTKVPRLERSSAAGEYAIGVGDILVVQVFEQPALATRGRIRPDGRIALPLVGELVAVGKTPSAVRTEIEEGYRRFIVSPRVTVNVEETRPVLVSVMGEVRTSGGQSLEPHSGVLQALAQAGGLSDFADESSIFVLRRVPAFRRIRFTYEALVNNDYGAATFPLRTGDVIVVE